MRRNEWLGKGKCEAGVFTAIARRESCGKFSGLPFSLLEPTHQRDTVRPPAPEKAAGGQGAARQPISSCWECAYC